MLAVILAGAKQFRVKPGDILEIERINANEGDSVKFDSVLMVGEGENATLGTPYVAGASVTAVVLEQMRGDKINIIKLKRRKHHLKHQGHRQWLTRIKVTEVTKS